MYIGSFLIKEFEGLNFARLSGDNNLIHTSNLTGYNSIYGNKIAHGVLVILKFLKIVNLKYFFNLKIQFKNGFKYNSKIKIIRIKNNKKEKSYRLIIDNDVCANIQLFDYQQENYISNLQSTILKKNYSIPKKIKKKFSSSSVPIELEIALSYLSKYVGTVYPGKNSLIAEINIFNQNLSISNKIAISSRQVDKRLLIIDNRLIYKNYYIRFKTLIRPELKINLNKPSKNILKSINSIKNNILILGASSGIGNDILKLFLNNKKIKIISTYYKNKINYKRKNLIVKNLNIENNISDIFNIIRKYCPLNIYYFPTPRIQNKSNDSKLIKLYRNYYIYWPIKIIKFADKYKCNFFYPSTTFIKKNNLSPYAAIKLEAEKKILKLKKLKNQVNMIRIPQINTKQNLLLINHKLPNFRNLISNNKKIQDAVFFKN